VTLFETVPRTVSFDPISAHSPGVPGNQVYIDGVPLNAGTGANTDAIGSLSAMLQTRDELSMNVQGQLDEIARGLVVAFAETDQTGSALPDATGLFTYAGGPAVPTGTTAVNGLALTLSVNGFFDPDVGGNPHLLRDGGANGAAYTVNTAGSSAFADNLISYTEQIDEPISSDVSFGLTGTYTLSQYAESSIGFLDSIRSTASLASESDAALSERLSSMLSASTGVNLDEELSMLIELEQSYQASARIISTVDEMFAALFGAFR
ncbi:MAG: flagellar basal body rod C-terminal domain-containing protein, partial [Pseudomonadota bacterium]